VLNLGFSVTAEDDCGSGYVLSDELASAVVAANREHAGGRELRTQAAYGNELWFRLRELGASRLAWGEMTVLDACCGSGFLSYHLLARAHPRELTLLDVSPEEVMEAELLVNNPANGGLQNIVAVCADLAEVRLRSKHYDVVVGNSFLHHFPDVPTVLATIRQLVRPGGVLVGLHEPTPAAVPLESGDLRHVIAYFLLGSRYLRRMRYRGPGLVRVGTTDVWMFKPDDLRRLLVDAGFEEVRVLPRYLLRPFVVAALGLHLSEQRPCLSRFQSALLSATVTIDAVLRRILPARAFGGLSFVAWRPT
jgi:2-polyprenyl-3-methyl-5-hydroxy-6-metoxy-1,4-benzoquinol methylase